MFHTSEVKLSETDEVLVMKGTLTKFMPLKLQPENLIGTLSSRGSLTTTTSAWNSVSKKVKTSEMASWGSLIPVGAMTAKLEWKMNGKRESESNFQNKKKF
jgi:hypothetical protein